MVYTLRVFYLLELTSVYESHDVSHPSWMSLSSNQLTFLFGTLRHPTDDLAQSMQQCNAHSRICHNLWMELCVIFRVS